MRPAFLGLVDTGQPGTDRQPPSLDLWVAQRDSVDDARGTPVNLGPTINGPYHEYCTTFSPDGHWMVFVSQKPLDAGGCTAASTPAPGGRCSVSSLPFGWARGLDILMSEALIGAALDSPPCHGCGPVSVNVC